MLGFDDAKERLHCKRSVLVGNPIKQEILFADKDRARQKLGIAKDMRMVVSFGRLHGQPPL